MRRAIRAMLELQGRVGMLEAGVAQSSVASQVRCVSGAASQLPRSFQHMPSACSGSLFSPCTCPRCTGALQHQQHPAMLSSVRHIGCGMNTCAVDMTKGPPPKVIVEYDPQSVDAFIALADAIEDAFPSMIVDGNEEGDGRPGSFEVKTPDGAVIFSRLDAKKEPVVEDILGLLGSSQQQAAA